MEVVVLLNTYRHDAPMNHEKHTASLAASTGLAAINIDGTTIKTANRSRYLNSCLTRKEQK